LEIKGPTFAEVNETIYFVVTSEGLPVKGAVVSFAGYQKETNESGIATFQIDFAGPFKAIAWKEGYVINSTLLWIFPKGNEKFEIRATRLHTEQIGETISSYKMAGANYASIKAYYLYDEYGNIYPASPFPLRWRRLTNEEHRELLDWQISLARSWGFKGIYLIAQPLPEAIFVEGKNSSPPLSGEAKQNFIRQMKKEAISLAEFAEEEKVDILDAFNLEATDIIGLHTPISSDFEAYKEILPELRRRFSGKIAVMLVGGIQHFLKNITLVDYDYSGFDYVALVFSARHAELYTEYPSEWENAIERYLQYAEYIKNKYSTKILLIWIAGIEVHNATLFRRFLKNGGFEDYNEVKVWLLNSILEKALKMNLDSIEVYTLWYFSRFLGPHGPYADEFAVWQNKKPLNIVAKYFSYPWNHIKKNILSKLQCATLAVNSIRDHSSILSFWLSSKLETGYAQYKEDKYTDANKTTSQLLGFFKHITNPLNITIDGDDNDWQIINPVYFNPSKIPPWGPMELWIRSNSTNVKDVERMENLKAVYAVNDQNYLYLMLEFYDHPPSWLPLLAIDTTGDWIHIFGGEFHIPLRDGSTEIWKVAYTSTNFDPQGPGSVKVGVAEVKVGKVVEIRIPLKTLGSPKKVNLIIWYPGISPWGDMEVEIVNWDEISFSSSIIVMTSSQNITNGESITISGFIYPAHANQKVTLKYKMPNGIILTRNVTSTTLGEFEDTFTPQMVGNWTIKASWSGDIDHEGSVSKEVSFLVIPKPTESTAMTLSPYTTTTPLTTTTTSYTITESQTTQAMTGTVESASFLTWVVIIIVVVIIGVLGAYYMKKH